MIHGTAKSYRVFVRDWWKKGSCGIEPYPRAPQRTIARHCTFSEAQKIAKQYNKTHKPGWKSRMAELDEES